MDKKNLNIAFKVVYLIKPKCKLQTEYIHTKKIFNLFLCESSLQGEIFLN